MAMVECKECKKQVSNHANTCPHCGVMHPGYEPHGCGTVFIRVLILLALIYLIRLFWRAW